LLIASVTNIVFKTDAVVDLMFHRKQAANKFQDRLVNKCKEQVHNIGHLTLTCVDPAACMHPKATPSWTLLLVPLFATLEAPTVKLNSIEPSKL